MNLLNFLVDDTPRDKRPLNSCRVSRKRLAGPNIYIKRDDLLGLTAGGNKTRKLEFLVADALCPEADTLITCGAVQSNHCRLTLAAAVKEGLSCRLVLKDALPAVISQRPVETIFFSLLGLKKSPWCPAVRTCRSHAESGR